jgi:hypothetical protein
MKVLEQDLDLHTMSAEKVNIDGKTVTTTKGNQKTIKSELEVEVINMKNMPTTNDEKKIL